MVSVYLQTQQEELIKIVSDLCEQKQIAMEQFPSAEELTSHLVNLESSQRAVIIHDSESPLLVDEYGLTKSCTLHISDSAVSTPITEDHYYLSIPESEWRATDCGLYLDLALSQAKVDQIQQQLEQLKQQNQQIKLSQDYYLHESRNALSILEGKCSQVIKSLSTTESADPWIVDLKTKVESLAKVSKRLVTLTDDLANTRVIEKGKLPNINAPEEISYLNVKDLLETAVSDLAPALNNRLNLTMRVPDELKVAAHRDRLLQVFENLIQNANRATLEHEKPWIKIIAEQNKSSVLILFVDSGQGIEQSRKIFDEYYTTKAGSHNSGLGLKICRDYLEQMNAEIYYRLYDFEHTCLVIEFLDQK